MAQAATQTTSASNPAGNPARTERAASLISPAPHVEPNREKALQILSKSIYRELRENGYQPKQIVALATEIISLVTTDIGDGSLI